MTKYLSSAAFNSPANSKSYSDNYDSVFGKQEPEGKHECPWSPSHGWEHCDFCESCVTIDRDLPE